MKARPILMNGDMVRATIREIEAPGTGKSQTRRVIKYQPRMSDFLPCYVFPRHKRDAVSESPSGYVYPNAKEEILAMCPYGQPGDLLYVRETFVECVGREISYAADNKLSFLKYSPSIHMPRWASRITLEITDVRVERLQDISEEDAQAEGCYYEGWSPSYSDPDSGGDGCEIFPTGNFAKLWDSIYGTWSANPWVWVVEFKPHMKNVDEFLLERGA